MTESWNYHYDECQVVSNRNIDEYNINEGAIAQRQI